MTAILILLGATFVTAFCIAAGELFLRKLQISLEPTGRRFAHFVTGSVYVSSFVFALCATGNFRTWLLVSVGVVVIAGWVRICRPSFRPNFRLDLPPLWQALFWVPWLVFGAVYVIVAMSPEFSPDGTRYHLGLVYRYYEHHGFFRITTNMFAGLYGGIEMLFLAAFAIGKHSAAALVHAMFLLLAPFGILAIARRMGEARAGVLASMLFYLSPVVAKDGTSAYIDTGTAAVLIAAFYFLQVWRSQPLGRAFVPGALLAGFAVTCKMTSASFVLYALFVSLTAALPWAARFRQAGLITLLAAIPVVPWMAKNAAQFGNPFFPVLNRFFPNPFMYQMLEDEMRRIVAHLSNVTWPQIPWEATTGGQLAGILGPIFLLAPLALLAIARPAARHALYACAFILVTYPASIGTRFLIPALPFLGLALSIAITRIPRVGTSLAITVLLAHALLSWPPWIERWSGHFQWRIDVIEWRAALRLTPEPAFLRAHWADYDRGLLLDRLVAPGERVFSPNMGQMAYQRREVLGPSDSALGRRIFLTFLMPVAAGLGSTFTRDMHVSTTTTHAIRLTATTAFDTDMRISEVRFFSGNREIPRQPSWRISASGNPWEAPLAFDNIAVSAWSSGDVIRPGTWLGVDFGEPVTLDRIVIEQSADQRWMSIQPAFPDGTGWAIRPSRYVPTETPRRASLRLEVRDELWRLGVRWMLMPDSQFGATDIRDHAPEWGMVQAEMVNDFRLWKLLPPGR